MTMTTSSVTTNTAVMFGGGLYVHGGATALVTDDTLENNAARFGGGIANDGATTTVLRGAIRKGTAQSGGGVANLGGTFTGNTTTINNNTAGNGGGVFQTQASGIAAMTLDQASVHDNKATSASGGGGIYVDSGQFALAAVKREDHGHRLARGQRVVARRQVHVELAGAPPAVDDRRKAGLVEHAIRAARRGDRRLAGVAGARACVDRDGGEGREGFGGVDATGTGDTEAGKKQRASGHGHASFTRCSTSRRPQLA